MVIVSVTASRAEDFERCNREEANSFSLDTLDFGWILGAFSSDTKTSTTWSEAPIVPQFISALVICKETGLGSQMQNKECERNWSEMENRGVIHVTMMEVIWLCLRRTA
jgi:hypothetical protein